MGPAANMPSNTAMIMMRMMIHVLLVPRRWACPPNWADLRRSDSVGVAAIANAASNASCGRAFGPSTVRNSDFLSFLAALKALLANVGST
jgi:hypothetical protein